MIRLANAVDFWRGFALITIFINHIPGNFFESFTHRNISISDSAELFVFLAGWALRLLVDRFEREGERVQLMARLGGRALTIYAAQILISSIAIAMLALAATVYENPLFLEWYNAAPVFYDPIRAHIGLVLLTHQLGYFDILPLYVVLMAFVAPVIVCLNWLAPRALLPASLAVYIFVVVFQIPLPTWPTEGQWFFNPLAWQAVFVLGFAMAGGNGAGGMVRRHLNVIRAIALPIVIFAAFVVWFRWWPDPTRVPEPKLLFLNWKTYVTPARLIQFLALVAVMSWTFPWLERSVPPVVKMLALLGRNALVVFCVGSVLSLLGQIIRFASGGSAILDFVIVMSGVLIMIAAARLAEIRKFGIGRLRMPGKERQQ